jgi:hypothetical protein
VISPRRLLAGVATLLTVCVVAAGCDSSPFAASINGQVIKQTALNAELRQFGGNSYYVKLAEQGIVSAPVTVAGTGTGNYTSKFAASVLTQMVIATAAHQELARTHQRPSAGQYAATRAVDSVLYGPGAWSSFSPSFRTTLVDQDADLALVEPNGITSTELRSAQTDYSTQLFSRVCVRTVAVGVDGSDGKVDFAASLARAKAVAASIEAAPATATPGYLTCYSAADFETLSLASQLTVLDLATGKAATPQKTATGYLVTAVTSRTQLPSDLALARAFTVAVNQSRGTAAQAVAGLLRRARVEVNPGYGTWKATKGIFTVTPTSAPSGGVAT